MLARCLLYVQLSALNRDRCRSLWCHFPDSKKFVIYLGDGINLLSTPHVSLEGEKFLLHNQGGIFLSTSLLILHERGGVIYTIGELGQRDWAWWLSTFLFLSFWIRVIGNACFLYSLPQSKPLGGLWIEGEQYLVSSLSDCLGRLSSGGGGEHWGVHCILVLNTSSWPWSHPELCFFKPSTSEFAAIWGKHLLLTHRAWTYFRI